MGRKAIPVGRFVETLCSFQNEPITRDRILNYLRETAVDRSTLDPFVHFLPDAYTRNLIHRDELMEVMAVCWQPGQRTVIHTHNGQLGWMSVERGALAVINYKWLGCNASDNQNVVGMDCLAGATELDIDRREVQECFPGGPVNTVDKVQTIHQVVVQGREPVISLHVYSRPIDSCVAFDLEKRTCYRRALSFYSRYGQVVVREGDLAASPLPPSPPE
ncbi:MAG TPA: cysteine dioxygenase family protein [Vicinamibacteria bacterium]|nr:cysteine dioxygenase family protein [Vicinamibacteria bacterium]